MKKVLLSGLLIVFLNSYASAQTNTTKKKKTANKTVVKKQSTNQRKDTTTVTMTNASSSQAYAPSGNAKLQITDPTINLLNQRAAGAPVRISGSGVVGMPKGTYGFANGKILLRSTTATSPGTGYGSGAVGTGTSIQGAGTSESTIGVNGKSPYAGPWLWGDKRPVYNLPDSSRRQ